MIEKISDPIKLIDWYQSSNVPRPSAEGGIPEEKSEKEIALKFHLIPMDDDPEESERRFQDYEEPFGGIGMQIFKKTKTIGSEDLRYLDSPWQVIQEIKEKIHLFFDLIAMMDKTSHSEPVRINPGVVEDPDASTEIGNPFMRKEHKFDFFDYTIPGIQKKVYKLFELIREIEILARAPPQDKFGCPGRNHRLGSRFDLKSEQTFRTKDGKIAWQFPIDPDIYRRVLVVTPADDPLARGTLRTEKYSSSRVRVVKEDFERKRSEGHKPRYH